MRIVLAILVPLLLLPAAAADDISAPVPRVWTEGDTVFVGAVVCPVVVLEGPAQPCSPPGALASVNTTDPTDAHVLSRACLGGYLYPFIDHYEACTPML